MLTPGSNVAMSRPSYVVVLAPIKEVTADAFRILRILRTRPHFPFSLALYSQEAKKEKEHNQFSILALIS